VAKMTLSEVKANLIPVCVQEYKKWREQNHV